MCLFRFFKRKKNRAEEAKAEIPAAAEPIAEKPAVVQLEASEQTKTEAKVEKVKAPAAQRPTAVKSDGKVFIRIRYNRSFTAKLIQSDDKVKGYYGEIRNELMRYKVKTRLSWRYETFKIGRKLLAKISMRGKTLSLYLALNPAAYADTKYKIDDVSSVAKNASVPTLYKIKNDRRCKYSKELIAAVMAGNGLEGGDVPTDDYVSRYPYEELEPLIERGLVKLLKSQEKSEGAEEGLIEISEERYERLTSENAYPEVVESISVTEAEERIADEVAETFIQESERYSDKTKKDIVNIDTLGKYFNAGDDVTIEEIKKRVPSVNKRATYIKVLARGTLDKALNVEADDFSPSAVKMIVLTGGTVSRTKTKN